jgi:cation diffusion facilitator family transporter
MSRAQHTHGLVDESIVRSRDGVRTVAMSLVVLGAAALVQAIVFVATGSVALLADLVHNVGDAATALPLGIAFFLRSARGERLAGYVVVAVIFVSAVFTLWQSVTRLLDPEDLADLGALAAAGLVGFAGNEVAAQIRIAGGRRLDSPALIADGNHARTDGLLSLGVLVSAAGVALGAPIVDPLVGLLMTAVILMITWSSWQTVSGHRH